MRVYLAGPIHGKDDVEAAGWRQRARMLLEGMGHDVEDPMDRDYRGVEDDFAEQVVDDDKEAIERCDTLLVNADSPSWGTAMEVVYGVMWGKQVIAFSSAPTISPWLRCHTHAVFGTLGQAIDGLCNHRTQGMR